MDITMNRFKPGVTDTVYIHGGRFHADDAMFAAMASIAIQKYKKTPIVRRTNELTGIRGENIIVGDIGRGVYDHHEEEGNTSVGAQENTEDYMAAACGLLYKDIKNIIFPDKKTETQNVFEAFLDIIEHCDNTPDNSTFSDSINLMTPSDVEKTEERAMQAVQFCKDIVLGFIDAHLKEKSGKMWAVPKTNRTNFPGIKEKIAERYTKTTRAISRKYKYVSYNDKTDMKLRAITSYSVAMSVLPDWKRHKWKDFIEECDRINQEDIRRREEEEWPVAVANMKNLTIVIDNYIPWAKYIKDINAVFIVQESQRGGYSVSPIKTNNGKYRCPANIINNAAGCTYVANDGRFLLFDSKETAIEAAHTAGASIEAFLEKNQLQGYRKIYGGIEGDYTGAVYQDVLSEDIALKCYVRKYCPAMSNLTDEFVKSLLEQSTDNQYLTHCCYTHIKKLENGYKWDNDANVLDSLKGKEPVFATDFASDSK